MVSPTNSVLSIRKLLLYTIVLFLFSVSSEAQETNPYIQYNVPFQNLLKFNRFLVNPTFSAVREDKSYVNLFHRTQSTEFDDSTQNYFLSYNGKINTKNGVGVSLFNQQEGIVSNLGILVNYSRAVQLGKDKSLTFGLNIPYFSSSLNLGRAIALADDPVLNNLEDSSIISFQPGLNFSWGNVDVGVFAQNLVEYDIRSGQSLGEINEKIYSGHLQYEHRFEDTGSILAEGRFMPILRTRLESGQGASFGGGFILDLPKIGWLQGGYDQLFGASAGAGINLGRRVSLGYNFERNLDPTVADLGITHEISIGYSFIPNDNVEPLISDNSTTEDDFAEEETEETEIVENASPNSDQTELLQKEIERLRKQQEENYAVINELIYKLDSVEANRKEDLERRFDLLIKMAQRNGNPDVKTAVEEEFNSGKQNQDANTLSQIRERAVSIVNNRGKEVGLGTSTGDSNSIKTEPRIKNSAIATQQNTIDIAKNKQAPIDVDNTTLAVSEERLFEKDIPNDKRISNKENADNQATSQAIATTTEGTEFSDASSIGNSQEIIKTSSKADSKNKLLKSEVVTASQEFPQKSGTTKTARVRGSSTDLDSKSQLAEKALEPENTVAGAISSGKAENAVLTQNTTTDLGNTGDITAVSKLDENVTTTTAGQTRVSNLVWKEIEILENGKPTGRVKFVPVEEIIELENVREGHYIIANVFANKTYLRLFLDKLKKKGIEADYFNNPKNGLNYVFLGRYDTVKQAEVVESSQMFGKYREELWVMSVTNPAPTNWTDTHYIEKD